MEEQTKTTFRDSWWWKTITLQNFIQYVKNLIDKTDPASSHAAINLLWGVGSFFCYWADHFLSNPGKFVQSDFMFITAMAGITTLSAVASKLVDNSKTGA